MSLNQSQRDQLIQVMVRISTALGSMDSEEAVDHLRVAQSLLNAALAPGKACEGTPKTLKQALRNALTESGLDRMQWHIRDFMAQKFSVAMYRARDEQESDRLRALFKILIESKDIDP